MSEDSGLPTNIEFGDTYALRTFAVKDGRLASSSRRESHWVDGVCVAICTQNPATPTTRYRTRGLCGVYRFWTVAELLDQYTKFARRIVTVVRMDGLTIEGDNGVKASAAQIVAWWCEEDATASYARLAACAASAPGARRYFDRDVMVHIHGLSESAEGK